MTPSKRTSSYRTLASFSRIQLLHFLQQRGTMTVGDLAEATGLHHNTAREHLQRLIGDGFVTCQPESKDSKGRPRMLYSAAAGPDHADGSVRAAKARAAERHGDQVRRMLRVEAVIHSPLQRQLDALDDHLDDSGFDARLAIDAAAGDHRVHLHECPYRDMVAGHPEVCRVHFGLLKALLETTGGPLSADALHPLVEPNTCVLDLHRSEAEAEPEQQQPKPETERAPAIIYHGVSGL